LHTALPENVGVVLLTAMTGEVMVEYVLLKVVWVAVTVLAVEVAVVVGV